MADAKIPLTFRIYKGDTFVREETLTQAVIKVGKLSSSHLRLDDDSVSRMHAVIEVTGPGDVSIIDLGSTKGTFVNGQKVNKAKLQSGDAITLGDTKIEVTVGAAEEADDEAPTMVQAQPGESDAVIASTPKPAAPAPAAASTVAPPTPAVAPPTPAVAPPPGIAPPPGMYGSAAAAAPAPQFGMDAMADDLAGARAVEVAAMLGDSVVDVKHVMDPKVKKVSSVTYGMFAAGALLLVLAAASFTISVSNAKFNKKAKHHWTEPPSKDGKGGGLGRPLHEFRPRRLSLAYDWMAFGGLFGGLFFITFGMVRYRNEKKSPFYKIGRGSGVDFATDAAPMEEFPMVAPLGDDFVFNFAQGMDGEMIFEGQSTPLSELQAAGRARPSTTAAGALEVSIPPKARFRVKAGNNTFIVSSVPRPRTQPTPLFATVESRAMAYFAGSLIVHMGFWALLRTIPPDPRALALDLGSNEGRLTKSSSKAQEDPKQEEDEKLDNKDDESGGTGTAMALDEGKMGKKESNRAEGQYKMKKTSDDPQLAKKNAMEQARTQGVAGALRAMQGDAFASITGSGDFSSGLDDDNVYGGLLGDAPGEMQGGFGFGRSGFGPGGGGTGWGTIGTGRYGTIGHGSGTGSGYGAGSGRGGMRGRKSLSPNVKIGQATATGDLDKSIIRRYIRRKRSRIKYCYEKQLSVKENLKGTVVTNFTISPTGAVISSRAKGVSGAVANCVASVISTIQFPKPRGGGLVQVRYPFHFRPTR
jgi:pSer/pThr/pTyr-binding forkhead associated (FHA) protein